MRITKERAHLRIIRIMSKEELFEKYGVYHLWYHIGDDKEKQKAFLQFAKDLELKWVTGSEIHPETDNCSTNMGLNIEKGTIGFLTYLIWYSWENGVNRDDFKRISFETGEWYDDPNAKKAVP